MDHAELRDKVDSDEDFIILPRHGNSLEAALKAYPDGLPPRMVAKAMGRSEEEVAEMHAEIVQQLRQLIVR